LISQAVILINFQGSSSINGLSPLLLIPKLQCISDDIPELIDSPSFFDGAEVNRS
jgi:hypothetical protein